MNYKVTNTRVNREPKIHRSYFGTNDKPHVYPNTICGLLIENSLYGRWEQTDKEVTCKKCLKKF